MVVSEGYNRWRVMVIHCFLYTTLRKIFYNVGVFKYFIFFKLQTFWFLSCIWARLILLQVCGNESKSSSVAVRVCIYLLQYNISHRSLSLIFLLHSVKVVCDLLSWFSQKFYSYAFYMLSFVYMLSGLSTSRQMATALAVLTLIFLQLVKKVYFYRGWRFEYDARYGHCYLLYSMVLILNIN